ncbi:MAG: FAD-dependent oxidoreductase [Kiritimatiellia bacterium]|nr:FAD-dependent oxidoreductase [Kiritimatiellia bacterium]
MKKKRKQSRVLVLGAGVAGITAAERLGNAGVEVHLVERAAEIGGKVRRFGCKAAEKCLRCNVCLADDLFRRLPQASNVKLRTNTELLSLEPGCNGRRYTAALAATGCAAPVANQDVDAVVLATGFEPYAPAENSSWGYGRVRNIIIGIDLEQQLADKNKISRPSDGTEPKRVAFIQCVGSRTEEIFRRSDDTDYCSVVCCAYALRMARRILHHSAGTEVTIFYMDIQNFGKAFNQFYAECRQKVVFIRSRPHEINQAEGDAVRVKYAVGSGADGRAVDEREFDLVVLAVGMRPAPEARELADRLRIPLDPHGFFGLKGASALPDLQREGIYVAGANEAPKDIAGCIAQAEAVCAEVLNFLQRT